MTTYVLMWVAFAAYLGALAVAPRLGKRAVWGTILVAVGAFAVAPVLLSQDVYSYVDYARLGVVHDLNPYSHAPAAAPGDPAFDLVGWPDAVSAYGPLFTLAGYPPAWLPVPTAVAVLKAVAAGSVLGLAALTGRLAALRGVDRLRAAAFVALNPLVLVHVVGGAHNDATAMLVAMTGAAAVLSARNATAGAALVSAATIKVSTAFVLPFALLAAARGQPRCNANDSYLMPYALHRGGLFVGGGAVAAIAIGPAAYLAFGWHWLGSLALVGENQARVSNYSLPNLASEASNVGIETVRAFAFVAYLILLAVLLVRVYRGADWIRAAGWGALGLLLATAWLLPWYVVWALPFAAISRDPRLISAVLALTALQLAARIPL